MVLEHELRKGSYPVPAVVPSIGVAPCLSAGCPGVQRKPVLIQSSPVAEQGTVVRKHDSGSTWDCGGPAGKASTSDQRDEETCAGSPRRETLTSTSPGRPTSECEARGRTKRRANEQSASLFDKDLQCCGVRTRRIVSHQTDSSQTNVWRTDEKPDWFFVGQETRWETSPLWSCRRSQRRFCSHRSHFWPLSFRVLEGCSGRFPLSALFAQRCEEEGSAKEGSINPLVTPPV
ncbi:hypothetical protein GN956_G11562 [Arapaima gigas]